MTKFLLRYTYVAFIVRMLNAIMDHFQAKAGLWHISLGDGYLSA